MASRRVKQAERDSIVRVQLLEHLSDVVQGLLRPVGDTTKLYVRPQPGAGSSRNSPKVFGTSDLTNTLCCSLEAILIHGVKDSYSSRVSSFFMSDPDRMPVPNFWPAIMTVCHKDDIKEVCQLSFITSDVGRGRAWLRVSLNGGQLSSYLLALSREASVLRDFYSSTALLRCSESCDRLLGTLQQLTSLRFQLAINAAVLNTWTQTPLVLAGLWVPPHGHTVHGWTQPVRQGIDAAVDASSPPTITTDTDKTDTTTDNSSVFLKETPFNDHLLDAILAATPTTQFIEDDNVEAFNAVARPKPKPLVVRTLYPRQYVLDNGIEADARIEDIEEEQQQSLDSNDPFKIIQSKEESGRQQQDGADSLTGSCMLNLSTISDDGSTFTSNSSMDYATLVTRLGGSMGGDYRYVGDAPSFRDKEGTLVEGEEDDKADDSGGFEIISFSSDKEKYFGLTSLVPRLCPQAGLDEQNYQCHGCRAFIGIYYGEYRVCAMDGASYCVECHSGGLAVVPARALHNWDLRQHPVSNATREWLEHNMDNPMMDVRATNPSLYTHVEELAQLKTLRTQLTYLRAYLFTCSTPGVGTKLREMVLYREHLYDHVHLYSLSDLLLIARGGLVTGVASAVCFALVHVRECTRCSARGFVCELCKDGSDIIFPFQLDVVQTCPDCCAVSHHRCARDATHCPRCVRRRLRQQQLEERDGGVEQQEEENGGGGSRPESAPVCVDDAVSFTMEVNR